MVEYFHIYVNGGLTYVGLVLSQAVQVMDKLKADGNEPVMKSYMLDPAVLEAMSQSYDNERLADHGEICANEYCEEKGIHECYGFHYCDECIHEHVYDECDPDPCKAKAEYISERSAENYTNHNMGGWSG